jgi:lysophospholipase L1-like esterase
MRSGRTARKIALLGGATLLALGAAEAVARVVFRPAGTTSLRLLLPDGSAAPLAEGFHYLYHYTEREREEPGPRGRLPSSFRQRIAYDRPTWDYFDADGAVVAATNALGFRDLEFTVDKPPGQFRIMALGDSFTYGLGVPLEASWPQVLEAGLGGTDGGIEVINAGWPNTAPGDYAPWFAGDGVRFAPDLVVLALCLNDLAPVPMLAYPIADPEPWLGGISVLLDRLQRELEQRRLIAEPRDHAAMVDADPSQWEATQAGILAIRDAAAGAGAGFALVVLPMMSGLGPGYPYRRMHAMVDTFARREGLTCLDLLPAFEGLAERDLWVHSHDQHPNHLGQRRIAEAIEAGLRAGGLLR